MNRHAVHEPDRLTLGRGDRELGLTRFADPTAAGRRMVLPRAPQSPWFPAVVALTAVPMLRPNLLGEALAPVAFVLMAAAALLTLLRMPAAPSPVRAGRATRVDPAVAFVTCIGLAYLYVVVRESLTRPLVETQITLQGLVLTLGPLVCLLILCRDPEVRVRFVRGFVALMAVLCGLYAVTALFWAVAGVGSGQIGTFPVGKWGPQPLYLPFTPTVASQPVLGLDIPRFSGLGREPGWMAMYCAAAFFLARAVGLRSRTVRIALLVGLLGTVSTAGFGVFVVCWAYNRFLRDRGGISLVNYGRQIVGLGAMGLAVWLANDAPILGLSAKSTQNAASIGDREAATDAGLYALTHNPWGGQPAGVQAGVNLISDIALSGLPFVLLVALGFALAGMRTGPTRLSNAIVLVVFATLLLSQPAKDSTWALGLVVLSATLRRPDTLPATPAALPTRSTTPDPADRRTTEGSP